MNDQEPPLSLAELAEHFNSLADRNGELRHTLNQQVQCIRDWEVTATAQSKRIEELNGENRTLREALEDIIRWQGELDGLPDYPAIVARKALGGAK
jgi:chromosome segregation ATPase